MIVLTVRTSVVTRLTAITLLALMALPLAGPYSTIGRTLDTASIAAESVTNDTTPLDALVDPPSEPVVEQRFLAAVPDVPAAVTTALAQAYQVLRL